jgi:hypothetical protein
MSRIDLVAPEASLRLLVDIGMDEVPANGLAVKTSFRRVYEVVFRATAMRNPPGFAHDAILRTFKVQPRPPAEIERCLDAGGRRK